MAKLVAENEYTDSELLALWREAHAKLSVGGQSYRIGSREFTAADLKYIREQIEWLEQRVNNEDDGLILTDVRLHRR